MARSLNNFLWLRAAIVALKRLYLVHVWGMDIHPTATFSLSTRFDLTNPRGIHIGEHTYIAFDAAILTHDMPRGIHVDTRIGRNCFIGARSIILPGVSIGDGCVIGAGSVVTHDIPAGSIAAGNPARIIRNNVAAGPFGRLPRINPS